MTPQEKLAGIKKSIPRDFWDDLAWENHLWLIARVEQLEAVVKKKANGLYADDAQRTRVLIDALTTGPKTAEEKE